MSRGNPEFAEMVGGGSSQGRTKQNDSCTERGHHPRRGEEQALEGARSRGLPPVFRRREARAVRATAGPTMTTSQAHRWLLCPASIRTGTAGNTDFPHCSLSQLTKPEDCEMPALNYSSMTKAELETLLKNATRLSDQSLNEDALAKAQVVIEDAKKELSKRKGAMPPRKGPSEFAGFIWRKPDRFTNVLDYNGTPVAEIILVANHSQTNRDVYDAYVVEKKLPGSFEYIATARSSVLEEVRRQLARGDFQVSLRPARTAS